LNQHALLLKQNDPSSLMTIKRQPNLRHPSKGLIILTSLPSQFSKAS